jgi:hypothetical protein
MAQNEVTMSFSISSNGTGNAYDQFFLAAKSETDIFYSGNLPLSMTTSRIFLAFPGILSRDNRLFNNFSQAVSDHIPFQNRELDEHVLILGNGWREHYLTSCR